MLVSVGKSSAIGEMLTISEAEVPGALQTRVFDSFDDSVHFGGTLNDIPCWSHLTSRPPASAAVWAAVGCGRSTGPLELVVPGADSFPAGFNLPARLQIEQENASAIISRIFFMANQSLVEARRAMCFYSKELFKSNVFPRNGLGQAGQQCLRGLEMRLWWELQVISNFHLRYLRCLANSTMKCICGVQEL